MNRERGAGHNEEYITNCKKKGSLGAASGPAIFAMDRREPYMENKLYHHRTIRERLMALNG